MRNPGTKTLPKCIQEIDSGQLEHEQASYGQFRHTPDRGKALHPKAMGTDNRLFHHNDCMELSGILHPD